MNRLDGKVAVVTGAARGMGRATAELFAQEGARVVGGDVRVAEDVGDSSVEYVHLDVTDENSWTQVVADTIGKHGNIDILVNNAGIVSYEPILETTAEVWNRVIAVNQLGVMLGMRSVIPSMIENGGGSIVNISSIWGLVGDASAAAYHASKGAVTNMTRNVANTHARDNIRVNSVHPGYIITPLNADQAPEINEALTNGTMLHRPGQPIEVAYGVLFLASDESSYVTGTQLVIDGGFCAQ